MSVIEQNRLVIIGFGGLGLELFDYIRSGHFSGKETESTRRNDSSWSQIAYADDQDRTEIGEQLGVERIGNVADYVPRDADRLLVAVGYPIPRFRLWNELRAKSGSFVSFIHPTASVSSHAKIGSGTIIGPMAVVNAGAKIGDNVLVNCYASVGHGGVVGHHSVLSPYSSVLGDAKIGQECWLGTRASVFPQVVVGDRCTIDAHSFAKMDVPDGHIVRCRTEYQVIRNRLVDSERKL